MWVQTFIDYLRFERNCSERTIRSYQAALEEFGQFYESLDEGLSWKNLSADIIRQWIVMMMDRGNTASSVNCRLSALRSFYKFLLRRKMVEFDPAHNVVGPKKEKPLPYFVRENEMNLLLDGSFYTDDYAGKRDHLILLTFYSTGVRLSELVGLNVADVDTVTMQLKVTGKRNKQRIIPFGQEMNQAVCEYLVYRENYISEKKASEISFFLNENRVERIGASKVQKIVKNYLSLVTTQSKKSPHVLRHSFATSMLNHHADLQSVKELLGHESLSTTEIYTHTSFEELKQMYKEAHPRAK